ncbi:MAG: rRNA maturation RNase YbeY [Leptolyngbyaceae cyanobacterium]
MTTREPQVELWVEVAEPLAQLDLPTVASWQAWFNIWLGMLDPKTSPINQYEVTLSLTEDVAIQQLNATYRHQDKATDVLAFAAQETEMPGVQTLYQTAPLPLGDVVISVETAERQRHHTNYSLNQELAWLAAHGLLHLLGWDHPDEVSLEHMLEKQACLLRRIGI